MENQNEITLTTRDTVTVFEIKGDVTVTSEPFLKEAQKSANEQGAKKLILVFTNGAYINSGGIALIIQLLAESRKNGQKVAITGLSEHFKKIFHMVGITRFAKIVPTVDEGVESLSEGS